jgi:hypothetical protein
LPSTAELTDTKVTSVGNHYSPTTNSASALNISAQNATSSATWGSTNLVTGVNISRDAKGHVTGLTVDSIQMPAKPTFTDTNTTYSLSGASTDNNSTYTVTLTPSSGSATTAKVPAATETVAGLMTANQV